MAWHPPPPPRNGKLELRSEKHFTFQVTVTLEVDKVPSPTEIEIGLNMNATEKNHFKWHQQVRFTIYPPPSFLPSFQYLILFYAWKGNLWISISNRYLKIWISGFQITVILELDDVPPLSKNEMCIFGLCSTYDWPSDLSDESWPKCKNMAAKSS